MKGSLGNPNLYFYGIIVKTPFWNEGGGGGRGGGGGGGGGGSIQK